MIPPNRGPPFISQPPPDYLALYQQTILQMNALLTQRQNLEYQFNNLGQLIFNGQGQLQATIQEIAEKEAEYNDMEAQPAGGMSMMSKSEKKSILKDIGDELAAARNTLAGIQQHLAQLTQQRGALALQIQTITGQMNALYQQAMQYHAMWMQQPTL